MKFNKQTYLTGVLTICAGLFAATTQAQTQHYTQTNLVSDMPGVAAVTDPNLVNPWGMSRSSGSDWWLSDNTSGLSTLYNGTGQITPLVVSIPPADHNSPLGSPTGTVFNGGSGFGLTAGNPAIFLFVTEDGTISGWNPGVNPGAAMIKVNEREQSVFKGVAFASVDQPFTGPTTYLYVADFRKGHIAVYDTYFHHVPTMESLFQDDQVPAGYAPFNVQNIGGNLYVAFAMQDSAKHDEVDGAGLGYVDVFSPDGVLLNRLEHGPWFNAPWGLAQASSDFGKYSHDILVGQFGSGEILAFNPVTGHYEGALQDARDGTLKIEGLWGLSFGNGTGAGPATTLYFTAGPDHEQHGLFGTITAVENVLGNGQ
jgi:uncharacterized protein (TIGR03118 family)